MRYNPRARLDTSQVENRRGGGGGFPVGGGGGGLRVGGGIGGLVLLVAIILLSQLAGGGGDGGAGQDSGAGTLDQCITGASANQDPDCALVADVNSIQSYW